MSAWQEGCGCISAGRKAKAAIRIFKPAHEIAYARLQALIQQDLIKAGKVKEFYEAISDILRHYIEDRFELRAPERTTEEFLVEIRDTGVLSEADRKALTEFLTHCDLVKFAKHSPTNEQIQHTFDLAKNFIEQTKSDEKQIDVTDRVEAVAAGRCGRGINAVVFTMGIVVAVAYPGAGLADAAQETHGRGNVLISKRRAGLPCFIAGAFTAFAGCCPACLPGAIDNRSGEAA